MLRKNLLLTVVIIFLISSIFYSKYTSADENEIRWADVKDRSCAFVFKLELVPSLITDYLQQYEFVQEDQISPIRLRVLHFPDNVTSVSINVTIISPTGYTVYHNRFEFKKTANWTDYNSFTLNESGVWSRKLSFKGTPTDQANNVWVYEYIDEKNKLTNESELKKLGTLPLGIRRIFRVYTLSQYAAIITSRANVEVARLQHESVNISEKLLNEQKNAADAMWWTAIGTISLAIATVVGVLVSRFYRKDTIKIKRDVHKNRAEKRK